MSVVSRTTNVEANRRLFAGSLLMPITSEHLVRLVDLKQCQAGEDGNAACAAERTSCFGTVDLPREHRLRNDDVMVHLTDYTTKDESVSRR